MTDPSMPLLKWTTHVFPQPYRTGNPRRTLDLSLVDASAANFSDCAVVWYIDGNLEPTKQLSNVHLKSALSLALRGYEHFCGRLHIAPYAPPALRYGRVQVTLENQHDDPGVEFRVCSYQKNIRDIIPERRLYSNLQTWERHGQGPASFVSPTKLANPLDVDQPRPKPSMAVQITRFSCGGIALGVKVAHVLADAQTIMDFAKQWSAISRHLLFGGSANSFGLPPPVEPACLDAFICGDITEPSASQEILEAAYALPVHRYDWWAPASNAPKNMNAARVPEILHGDEAATTQAGTRIPWVEWDLDAPTRHCVVHFTGSQIQHLYQLVQSSGDSISRQDAVLAHIWSCINRARCLEDASDTPVHCDVTFGLRPRLRLTQPHYSKPPSGSFTLIADVSMNGRDVCAPETGPRLAAALIRSTLQKFDAEAVGNLLHALHYESSPQRMWQAFLGKRHTLVTSWVRAGLYDVDFDGTGPGSGLSSRSGFGSGSVQGMAQDDEGLEWRGTRPSLRFADPIMQSLDGIVCIAEAAPKLNLRSHGDSDVARHWADDGIDVHVNLEANTMERLLEDAHLLPPMQPNATSAW